MPTGIYLHKGHSFSQEARQKISRALMGHPVSEGARLKMSQNNPTKAGKLHPFWGKHHSEETKLKISRARTGKGHPISDEAKQKISVAIRGEKSPFWQGGTSREPYTSEFNREFKRQIRKRNGYTCQLCGVPEAECLKTLIVHHIDYDKKNNLPSNLISLCNSCHNKTNHNREYWKSVLLILRWVERR